MPAACCSGGGGRASASSSGSSITPSGGYSSSYGAGSVTGSLVTTGPAAADPANSPDSVEASADWDAVPGLTTISCRWSLVRVLLMVS